MSHQPSKSSEARDTFIHFLMGLHGFTKQGEDEETQRCIDEAVAWFDQMIATKDAEREKALEEERQRIKLLAHSKTVWADQCMNILVIPKNAFIEALTPPPITTNQSPTGGDSKNGV